jgi:hypothetical protein
MRIDWTGKIIDEFYVLGYASVPVYLLDGPLPALFDAGFTGLAQVYQKGILEVLCTGHHMVLTGSDARKHLLDSLDQAADYVARVERFLLEEDRDVDRVVQRVKVQEWETKPLPKQPENAYIINTKARVQTVLKRMVKGRGEKNDF